MKKHLKPTRLLLISGIIFSLLGLICGGWSDFTWIADIHYQPKTETFDSIRSLTITTDSKIGLSPDNKIHYLYYHDQHHQLDRTSFQLIDGQLSIFSELNSILSVNGLYTTIFQLANQTSYEDYVPHILLPKGVELDELTVLDNQATVHLKQATIDTLTLNNEGDVRIENTSINQLRLTLDNANLRLDSANLKNTEVTSFSREPSITISDGNLTATNLTLEGSHIIHLSNGNLDIELSKTIPLAIWRDYTFDETLSTISHNDIDNMHIQNKTLLEVAIADGSLSIR